jgi:hypothetical protein
MMAMKGAALRSPNRMVVGGRSGFWYSRVPAKIPKIITCPKVDSFPEGRRILNRKALEKRVQKRVVPSLRLLEPALIPGMITCPIRACRSVRRGLGKRVQSRLLPPMQIRLYLSEMQSVLGV